MLFEIYSQRQRASVSLLRPLGELHADASDWRTWKFLFFPDFASILLPQRPLFRLHEQLPVVIIWFSCFLEDGRLEYRDEASQPWRRLASIIHIKGARMDFVVELKPTGATPPPPPPASKLQPRSWGGNCWSMVLMPQTSSLMCCWAQCWIFSLNFSICSVCHPEGPS